MIFSDILSNIQSISEQRIANGLNQLTYQITMEQVVWDHNKLRQFYNKRINSISRKELQALVDEIQQFYVELRKLFQTNKNLSSKDKQTLINIMNDCLKIKDSCLAKLSTPSNHSEHES